jgi:hypothetical protein
VLDSCYYSRKLRLFFSSLYRHGRGLTQALELSSHIDRYIKSISVRLRQEEAAHIYFVLARTILLLANMGPSKRNVATILVLSLSVLVAAVADVDPGYDVSSAAQVMVNLAGQSWEWGTTAEALLELYDPELSVFGSDPFPGGTVPSPAAGTFALEYAQSYIDIDGQVLVAQDSAVGDPASLGVSAILIGQSNSAYLDAANRQADYILNDAPRWSNGAISQRPDVAELWADNMAMSFPFCEYASLVGLHLDLALISYSGIPGRSDEQRLTDGSDCDPMWLAARRPPS